MTTIETFRGYALYDKKKSLSGFNDKILNTLFNLLTYSVKVMNKPRAAHYVIDQPVAGLTSHLYQDLDRFCKTRSIRGNLYICVEENRSAMKLDSGSHLHLAIILDSAVALDFQLLAERLRKYSSTGKATLAYRSKSEMPLDIDPQTGEVFTDKRGNFLRKGSRTYHNVRTEFADCFKRLSYLAKNYSKTCRKYSSSRIIKIKNKQER